MIAVYKKFFLMLGVTVLLCLSASVVWSESMDDLVKRNGVYYKKFSNIPFSGMVKGIVDHKWEFSHMFPKEKRLVIGELQKGLKIGLWEYYIAESELTKLVKSNSVGQLSKSGNYKIGKKDGVWTRYSKKGFLWEEITYKNDQKDGPFYGYHENGNISSKFIFKNDKMHGYYQSFYPSGGLKETLNYKNGLETGIHKIYHENGNIKRIKKLKIENGKVLCDADDKIFDLDGKFVREQKGC